jgi:uncharacterized cupredoxin-like copper-binding protein
MRPTSRAGMTALLMALATPATGYAAGDLAQQKPVVVTVELGNARNDLVFAPNELTFETGKLYKLVLHNPSSKPHYFTSSGFASRVFTRKVQIVTAPGEAAKTIGEIKGAIREIEVFPGGTVEWWFVPVSTGSLGDLQCTVKDDDGKLHSEKGMTGKIVIQ